MPYLFGAIILLASCSKNETTPTPITPKDPNTAEVVSVDRFSATTGHLQVRTATNGKICAAIWWLLCVRL